MGARIGAIASRRSFVALLAALFGGITGVRGQVSRALRYRPLARPVVIPLEDMATAWRARSFVADATTLSSAATPNQPVRVTGSIVRTGSNQFAAVCMRCPHELCDVDYISNTRRLAQEILDEIRRPVTDPVYVCPCHNSTFNVDGERLAGPAPRGLYRFRITNVGPSAIEIAEVEEDVLIFVRGRMATPPVA